MSNKGSVGTGSWRILFAALFAVAVLVSCGGSTGDGGDKNGSGATTYTITATADSHGIITPTGTTTVNKGASQSFTITPDAGYIMATVTVDGASVSVVPGYTFSNVQANHTISASFVTAPTGNNIVPLLVPSRISGVAPLSVFFDASGTTDAGVSHPFHDLEYTWDFGDTNAGIWAYGAKPGSGKNSATGPLASHVFETQGTYQVSLTVFDGTHTKTANTTITVQDPKTVFAGAQTVCVSAHADFVGCPAGATQVANTTDFATAIANISNASKRLLFRAGETWSAGSTSSITTAGPGYIGSYGTGVAPKIRVTGDIGSIVQFNADDWRMLDFEIDGQNYNGANGVFNAGRSQITWLRLNIHNVNSGFNTIDFSPVADQFTIQDSTVHIIHNSVPTTDLSGGIGLWIFAKRFAFQGNSMDNNGGGEQVARFPLLQKAVITNSDFANPAPSKEIIKLHQANPISDPTVWSNIYTEQVIIADNHSLPSAIPGVPWLFNIAPQNDSDDERLKDIILERNWMQAGTSTYVAMNIATTGTTTLRNNIIDMTNGFYQWGISITKYGPATMPAPNDVRIYNNTIYSQNANNSTGFSGIVISAEATNSIVRNNLASAPSASNPVVLVDQGTGTQLSNNLQNSSPAVLFITATPVNPVDFKLKAGTGNPARDTGLLAVPVFTDFFLLRRPQNGAVDIGAAEVP